VNANGALSGVLSAIGCIWIATLAGVVLPSAAWSATSKLYWTNSSTNTIGEANLDGTGVNQSLIADDPNPTGVAADGQHVYWTNTPANAIGEANLDGTAANPTFIQGGNQPKGVALDSTHVYWANEGDGTIGRANLDGTAVDQRFITGATHPVAVAVDARHMYWADVGTGSLGRANLDGTGVDTSFIGVEQPLGVAVDGQHVYWSDEGAFEISRASLDGTVIDRHFLDTPDYAAGVAVDAQHVYWANFNLGTIGRAKIDGSGADESFVAGGHNPFAVAISTLGAAVGPPTASIAAPQDGGFYAEDQRVTASYSCSEASGGPGITSCTGPVPDGSALDTATPGPHSFSVTAVSGDGQSATSTHTYNVLANDPTKPGSFKLNLPPPRTRPPAPRPTARVTTLGSVLLLNPRRGMVGLVLTCGARRGAHCLVQAVLSARLGGRRLVLGSVTIRIAGRHLTAVSLHVSSPSSGLGLRPVSAVLSVHSASAGLRPVNLTLPVTVRPLVPGTPPMVRTERASGIAPYSPPASAASATLAGTVNPEGEATQYHFELGFAAGSYDISLPRPDAAVAADRLSHLVTATASGLFGGVTYHYRVVAENASGITYGPDRRFSVPLVVPIPAPPPIGDVTEAGPVSLVLQYTCNGNPPPIVTGAIVRCLLIARNPQPAVVVLAPLVWGSVRPASVFLSAPAPAGTHPAPGAQELLPLIIPPGGVGVATTYFQVDHPGPVITFMVTQANGAPAFSTLAPGTPHVHLTVACAIPRRAKTSESCTITTTNPGEDSADFTSFEINPSPGLTDPQTIAGGPPAVLPPGDISQTTVRFRLRSAAKPRPVRGITVSALGRGETDRLPFLAIASSQ
jgi:hypothetical protein